MSDLRDYFSRFPYTPQPADGAAPVERLVFSVGVLPVKGTHLLFCDSWATPNDGVLVAVAPGSYEVQVEAQSYGTDGRISRLIVKIPGTTPTRGTQRGRFGVDVASAAVCDGDTLRSFASRDEGAWEEWLESFTSRDYDRDDIAGFFPFPEAATSMAYTSTGFGDGYYPVYELLEDERVVGAEVLFLFPDQGYFEPGPGEEVGA